MLKVNLDLRMSVFGSLGIAVIKNLLNTDYTDGHGSHGFLKDLSCVSVKSVQSVYRITATLGEPVF